MMRFLQRWGRRHFKGGVAGCGVGTLVVALRRRLSHSCQKLSEHANESEKYLKIARSKHRNSFPFRYSDNPFVWMKNYAFFLTKEGKYHA